jgi:hypothetical protein
VIYCWVKDGVTYYCQEYINGKERHAWWRGFLICLILSIPMHALILWVNHR